MRVAIASSARARPGRAGRNGPRSRRAQTWSRQARSSSKIITDTCLSKTTRDEPLPPPRPPPHHVLNFSTRRGIAESEPGRASDTEPGRASDTTAGSGEPRCPCWQRRGGHQHGRASYREIIYNRHMNDDCISGTMLHGRAPPLDREDSSGPAAASFSLAQLAAALPPFKADRLAAFGNKHPRIKHIARLSPCGYANARQPRIARVDIGRACAPTERASRANGESSTFQKPRETLRWLNAVRRQACRAQHLR